MLRQYLIYGTEPVLSLSQFSNKKNERRNETSLAMKTSRRPREQNPYFLTGRRRMGFFNWLLMQRTSMNNNERQRTPTSNSERHRLWDETKPSVAVIC
jgi:hypothetical protein